MAGPVHPEDIAALKIAQIPEQRAPRPIWLAKDDAELVRMIGVLSVDELAKRFNRSQDAVVLRCRALGLDASAVYQDHETIMGAAKRYSVSWETMYRALCRARVQFKTIRWHGRGKKSGPIRWVETQDVDDAMSEYATLETLHAAATRIGVVDSTMRTWLRAEGHRPPRRHKFWKLPASTFDAVAAKYLNKEMLRHAAERHGVGRKTLSVWLREAGVRKFGKRGWQVDPSVVDAVVKARREKEPVMHAARRLGVKADTLMRWLIASGHPRSSSRIWAVDPGLADEVVVKWSRAETLREAARRLKVSSRALSRWVAKHKIRTPIRGRWSPEAIDQMVLAEIQRSVSKIPASVKEQLLAKLAA